jgi:phosphatidate cytidylyltransferase
MLKHRLTFGLPMVAAAVAVVVGEGPLAPVYPVFFAMATLLVWQAASELCRLVERLPLRIRHPRYARFGTLFIVWANWLPTTLLAPVANELGIQTPTIKTSLAVFVVVAMVGYVLTAHSYKQPGDSTLEIAGYLFVFFYVGLLSTFLFQLRWLDADPGHGATAVLLTIFTCKLGDAGAFFVGRWCGRMRIAPILSPGKSLEGAVGGLTASVAAAWWIGAIGLPGLTSKPLLTVPAAVVFGVVVGVMGQIGDLMESLIKRDCQAKDASSAIPGFGGLLDVADSILFGAPAAYFFLVGLKEWTRVP